MTESNVSIKVTISICLLQPTSGYTEFQITVRRARFARILCEWYGDFIIYRIGMEFVSYNNQTDVLYVVAIPLVNIIFAFIKRKHTVRVQSSTLSFLVCWEYEIIHSHNPVFIVTILTAYSFTTHTRTLGLPNIKL
jgi:hypothetical protein